MKYLYDYLTENGLNAHYIILAGHEKSRKEFSKSTYADWIDSARKQALALKAQYGDVVLIGFSMGGLVATSIFEDVMPSKLVYINTPVYFWDFKKITANLICDFKTKKAHNLKRYFSVSMDKPLNSMFQFVRFLEKTKRIFNVVTCPALVTQCKGDDTVKNKSAVYIYDMLQGKKVIKFYENGAHEVFSTGVAPYLCKDILEFLKSDI